MSAVFMCDSCGNVFSANELGWKEFTEKGTGPVYNNPNNHGAVTRHLGPCCNPMSGGAALKPRIAIAPEEHAQTVMDKIRTDENIIRGAM